MSAKRRSSASRPDDRHIVLCMFAHLLAHALVKMSGELLLGDSTATRREMLKASRQLTKVLERELLGGRRPRQENVIDLVRLQNIRALTELLGGCAPDPRPPRRAA
jgi:hypothetical protein